VTSIARGSPYPAFRRELDGTHDRRVVELHVAQVEARAVRRREPGVDPVHLLPRERERLLGEDRQPGIEGGVDGRCVGA
jgi:hypothetical protein